MKYSVSIDEPLTISLIVGGGPPGERLEYSLVLSEADRLLTTTHSDELREVTPTKLSGAVSGDVFTRIREVLQTRGLPKNDASSFVPDSVVGTLTISHGSTKHTSNFAAEGNDPLSLGMPAATSAFAHSADGLATRDIVGMIIGEASRIAKSKTKN